MHADSVRLAVLLALYGGTGSATPLLAADVPTARVGIRSPASESTLPIHVIDRERIDRSGLVSLGDFLQQLPASGATVNTRYNSGGDGSTQIDLRNLGAPRTLVLVDGRRFIQGLGGATDLNAIPLAAVERIEILTGGGSALYGADAVAGVVNVVLRQPFDGAEARTLLGEYEQGDGRTEAYDFTIGDSSERASVLLNASYLKQEPVLAGDREFSAVPLFGFPANDVNTGASSTTPFGRFGFGPAGTRLPNGSPGTLTLIPGRPGTSAGDFRPFVLAQDGYNTVSDNYLSTPQERASLFARARYALSEAIAFESSILYNERRSAQQFAGFPLVLGVVGPGAARSIVVPTGALFNPFGAAVTRAQFRPPQLRRFAQDVDTFRFAGAFDGRLDAWNRAWTWSVGYGYTDSVQHDVATGLFSASRLQSGLGPSFRDAGGVARCGTPAAVVAGCVPLNIFGGPDAFTSDMFDYASFVAQDSVHREQHGYHATLAGDLFELPAGPLAFAAGYEYRRESGFDQPDAFVSSGASTGSARPPTRGGFSNDDVFVELAVPLLRNMPLAESLALDLAARQSDYSTFGDTTNASIGFRWQPFAELLVHGRYADSFRAPSISEMFLDTTDAFPNIFDPCRPSSPNEAAEVVRRCREGIGSLPPFPRTELFQIGSQYRVTRGGNPSLEPELGQSRTLGLRYLPEAGPGLELSLDWHSLELTDAIRTRTAQDIVDACYLRGELDACDLIARNAQDGEIDDVFTGSQNVPGGIETEGYDLAIRYARDTALGAFAFESRTQYLAYSGDIGSPDFGDITPDGTRSLGNLAGVSLDRGSQFHRITSNLTIDWERGDFGATVGVRYRSALDEDCSRPVVLGRPVLCSNPDGSPQFPRGENRLDATTYVDLQARWNAPWNALLAIGVRNLLDEDPPVSFSATGGNFLPGYDLPGRFWYVALTQRF